MSDVDIGDGTTPVGRMESAGRTQVLALSGGGYRGLYSAQFLAFCEARYKTQTTERFDLIAGTSIGALLAAGLACSVPAATLVETFTTHGKKIFPKSKLKDAERIAIRAPYGREPVRAAIVDAIGKKLAETSMRKIEARLLIVAVNYTTGSPAVFTSGGLQGDDASPVPLADAILASAAAPSFFPEMKIGTDDYIDGGVLANAPDLLAYGAARRSMAIDQNQLYMLSIGTAGRREGAALKAGEDRSSGAAWLIRKKLVQTIMASQEVMAVDQTKAYLGDRHLRIDEEPQAKEEKAIADLDQADQDATRTLLSLAKRSWETWSATRQLRDFFDA